ncbi:ABC transporter permease [Sulfurospirillum arcachonense]|uniref:ABC transporter permease n=1 Tax=Sulfurospirillum arcachonense TaxID=57666 RepID=UPI000469FF45|nr:FtsX-like permease family protein [Sulfurospirillum arcachonense]
MINKNFVDFSILLLLKDKKEYLFSFFIFTFIVFLASSILFISDSIKHDLFIALDKQHQIIVKNTKSGRYTPLSEEHIDSILQISGVDNVKGKVDGYYYFAQDRRYFHIVVDESLDEHSMIISSEIKSILAKFKYTTQFNFLTQDGITSLDIKKVIKSNIISNDVILVNEDIARKILNMDEDEYSYLDVLVPNNSEIDFISLKIVDLYPDIKVKTKNDLKSDYEYVFYYKGGIFMILYIVSMISFFILLKNQISSVFGEKKREIAIFRSIGFAIKDIIFLKFIQNSVVALCSYFLGVFLAYIFVFIFGAPLLKNIFLGHDASHIIFTPIVDVKTLFVMFIFTVIPFLASILLPAWKIAVEDMSEVIK